MAEEERRKLHSEATHAYASICNPQRMYSESRRQKAEDCCCRSVAEPDIFLSSGLHFLILLTTKFFTRLTELNQQYCYYYKTILVPKKKQKQKMIDQEIIN
jgi:hypothetical protein